MGMTTCRDCKTEMSTSAKACPKCGADPKASHVPLGKIIFIGLLALLVYKCSTFSDEVSERRAAAEAKQKADERATAAAKAKALASMTPEQRQAAERKELAEAAAKMKAEVEFQRALQIAQQVKKSTKNPDSFQLLSAGISPQGATCLEYRGTNSFNAVVVDRTAVDANYKVRDWNAVCAGKSLRNVSHIKAVL